MRQSVNSKSMQKNNVSAVLNLIYGNDGISRKEIAARTGLTPASVTNIVNHLMQYDYLRESDAKSARGEGAAEPECANGLGRRPVALHVNRRRYFVVGIELSADTLAAVVTDFCGHVLARGEAANRSDNTPEEAVSLAWDLAERLLGEAGADRAKVLGVGLTSSGPYDRESGTLLDPPNFHGAAWKSAPVRALLEARSRYPVYFDRDSIGCALAELGGQPLGDDGTLFAIMVNTVGIGGGLLIGSEVHYGLHNSAAEIGHLTVVPDGPLCGCGDRGCLEAVSSGAAVARALSETVGAPVTVPELIRRYRAGDAPAVEAVRYGAKCLGVAIGNVNKCVGPDCIALGGRFISAFPEYYGLVESCARARRYIEMPTGTRIVPFTHGESQSAVGAVRLVIQSFFKSLTA